MSGVVSFALWQEEGEGAIMHDIIVLASEPPPHHQEEEEESALLLVCCSERSHLESI